MNEEAVKIFGLRAVKADVDLGERAGEDQDEGEGKADRGQP